MYVSHIWFTNINDNFKSTKILFGFRLRICKISLVLDYKCTIFCMVLDSKSTKSILLWT
jgi:hypothetical protein